MSYNSGSNLSIAELKRLNDRDLAEAADVECTMTVTARNWTAVLNLLNRSLQQMKVLETQMERIMTKEAMEEYLDIQAGEAMGQREYMEATLEQFRQQAGNISERLSSDTKEMVRKTQSELWDMKREASSHISSLTDTQDKRMKRLTRVIGILAVGQTLFLVLASLLWR